MLSHGSPSLRMLSWEEALSGFPREKTLAERERNWHMMFEVSHDEFTIKTTLSLIAYLVCRGRRRRLREKSVTGCINKYISGVHQ